MATMLMVVMVSAVPAKPGLKRLITLADGTTVMTRLVGDENGHYWLAEDGRAFLQIGNSDTFQLVNAQTIKEKAQLRRSTANDRRTLRQARRRADQVVSYEGEKKGIIILVNFTDVQFSNTNTLFQRIANEENFTDTDLGFKGSMYDYFYKQSNGKFKLTFDVVGPYTVSNTQSYYGGNLNNEDMYPATMVIEACQLADKDVDFADYDWDNDGTVDQVYVVYAGKGEADGGGADTIWPHEWTLTNAQKNGDGSGPITLDNVTIDTYACGPEMDGTNGKVAGIGTMCHEFSHCLGFPDFYDTDDSGGRGMGYWDLMDSGCYNGDGYQPSGYTSYERWVAGWMTPIELNTYTKVENMKSLQDGGDAYIIYNDNNSNEYFLLENRQFSGWDESLPGEGLLILHVDYNSTAWKDNKPNDDPDHQRMTWIAADNYYASNTKNEVTYFLFDDMANDPFPYGSVNAFGASTTPAATFYNKTSNGTYYMDWKVKNIEQNSDKTVSFVYYVPRPMTLTFSPTPGDYTESQNVSISCNIDDCDIYYTTDGSTPTKNSNVYTEPILIESNTTLNALAVDEEGEKSDIFAVRYYIDNGGISTDNIFRRATSSADLISGLHCVIACTSENKAAGSLSNNVLTVPENDIEVNTLFDLIVIDDDVEVFTLNGSGSSFSFKNESGAYLYPKGSNQLGYRDSEYQWTIVEEDGEYVIKDATYGRMFFDYNNWCFTVYTDDPNSSLILANLYVENVETQAPSVATGISTVRHTITEGIYDLTGRRLREGQLKKGIYIQNGRKIIK